MAKFLNLFSKGDSCQLLVNLEGKHVNRYQSFKTLLNHNHRVLSLIAELEQLYYDGKPFGLNEVREKVLDLSAELQGLLSTFQALAEGKYAALGDAYQRIKNQLDLELNPQPVYAHGDLVLNLDSIPPEKRSLVGAKAGNLSIVKKELGLPVPEGFSVTAVAYQKFLDDNHLSEAIEEELSRFDPKALAGMEQIGTAMRTMILRAEVPVELREAILKGYETLERKSAKGVRISMRSSAIGEDTEAGFAGQFQTVLNVSHENILEAYKTVLASKYSTRALHYRHQQGFIDTLTPMAVAGIQMIDAKASGVLYTRDPEDPQSSHLQISSIRGLGEHLVDGSASPDRFVVDRDGMKIQERVISRKEHQLVSPPQGGTILEEIPEPEQSQPSLSDEKIIELANYGLKLEEYFGSPQDMEWAMDREDRLFILQSRPLNLSSRKLEKEEFPQEFPEHPILLSQGQAASPGIAAGPVFILKEGENMEAVPQGSILITRTASPNYAGLMDRIKGIITDIGSITSHLASVAREFGIPALFDTTQASSVLEQGQLVTLNVPTRMVYGGIVEELIQESQRPLNRIYESPIHRRLKSMLNLIASLHLVNPQDSSFSPEGCRTYHDITRFTHEMAVKEMFGLVDRAGKQALAVRLTTSIPLVLYLMDLGGGLREGLSTCETITPDDFESLPMKAIWKGFSHPGITWSGAINFDMKDFLTLMAVSATSESGEGPGGNSYALLSRDYLNFSAKFGYHFATVDTLCGENSSQNYIALQFAGGAGNYAGRSLRITFLADILKKLGFDISIQGDLLDASLMGYDQPAMEEKLDQLGRLLACSRLLDMAISNAGNIERLVNLFFQEDYNFLAGSEQERLPGFYVQNGDWDSSIEEGTPIYLQDGSKSGLFLLSGLVGFANKLWGASTQERLDNIGAYYYFPLAIAKNSEMADGAAEVQVKALKGNIDRAGGLALGIKNAGNYFVLRINALEDNVILFEYVNNKRFQRASINMKIESNHWYKLKVEVEGSQIKGYVDDKAVLEYRADKPVQGYVGLWTKADSVTAFRNLSCKDKKLAKDI